MSSGPWDHSTEDKQPFLALFTRGLIEWNNAESAVRGLLAKIHTAGESRHLAQWIVIFELGSRSIVHALRTLAYDIYEGEASEHILHTATYYDRLLLYRNYYVHGLNGVITNPHKGGQIHGSLAATAAKGKLSFDNDDLTLDMLQAFMARSSTLNEYASRVEAFIIMKDYQTPPPSPDKPPLPEVLAKTRDTMREIRIRNESAGGSPQVGT